MLLEVKKNGFWLYMVMDIIDDLSWPKTSGTID